VRKIISLQWPGQVYYGLILLDTFRELLGQLAVPNGELGPLIALWAFWRASSPENQRTLVANNADAERCRFALDLAKKLSQ
jgi:hypothetical protein